MACMQHSTKEKYRTSLTQASDEYLILTTVFAEASKITIDDYTMTFSVRKKKTQSGGLKHDKQNNARITH